MLEAAWRKMVGMLFNVVHRHIKSLTDVLNFTNYVLF